MPVRTNTMACIFVVSFSNRRTEDAPGIVEIE
jgi:hypothetical protein